MYPETTIWNDLRIWYYNKGSVGQLILLNTLLFLITGTIGLIDFLFSLNIAPAVKLFYLPASFSKLITQIWSLGSYMFLHDGIWHYLFNMLGLYFLGMLLSDFVPRRSIIPIYLLGGLVGGLTYLTAYNLFPVFHAAINDSYLVGASAAVMALLGAMFALQPNFNVSLIILGRVPIKYISIFIIVYELLMLSQSNAGGHLSHLGGMLLGYVYAQQAWYRYSFGEWLNNLKNLFVKPKQPRVVYRRPTEKVTTNAPSAKPNKAGTNRTRQEKVDAILDKVADSGYDSLSKEEKEFLFNISQDIDDK
jgi:membrane associated rhomboid family serine protease